MTDFDAVPDREQLQGNAKQRMRRATRTGLYAALATFFAVLAFALVISADESWTAGKVTALVVTVLVGTVLLLAGFLVVGRLNGGRELLFGADRATRRDVQRALRAGHTDNPRIDALARDSAAHGLRTRWTMWWFAAFALLQVVVLAFNIADRDDWWQVARHAGFAVMFGALLGGQVFQRRRWRRYLAHPAPSRAGTLAAGPPTR